MIFISIYSGKCDCFDTIVGIWESTDDEIKNNIDFYLSGNHKFKLQIDSKKDLIPFYPHLTSSYGTYIDGNGQRRATVFLTWNSYVDEKETDRLKWYLRDILKIYNRCKRKKVEFNEDEVVKELNWFNSVGTEEIIRELCRRVVKDGKKATTDGLHMRLYEHYRQELVDEMLRNGLNPALYGYARFMEEKDENIEGQ